MNDKDNKAHLWIFLVGSFIASYEMLRMQYAEFSTQNRGGAPVVFRVVRLLPAVCRTLLLGNVMPPGCCRFPGDHHRERRAALNPRSSLNLWEVGSLQIDQRAASRTNNREPWAVSRL
jgi:hypothetical protein